jgi:hypothetical protein
MEGAEERLFVDELEYDRPYRLQYLGLWKQLFGDCCLDLY